jgi:hypothetical protein
VKDHVCRESETCECAIQALEPKETCPVHGSGQWPPKCAVCGRFIRRKLSFFRAWSKVIEQIELG